MCVCRGGAGEEGCGGMSVLVEPEKKARMTFPPGTRGSMAQNHDPGGPDPVDCSVPGSRVLMLAVHLCFPCSSPMTTTMKLFLQSG